MYDPGTTTFMIMSCALVLMMGPALALFYGGLSRRKNVVSTMLMCVMAMGAVGCLWAILGDSIAYGGPDAFDEDGNLVNVAALFVGGLDRLFSSWSLAEMTNALSTAPESATYADVAVGTYPGLIDVAFQAEFAMVTAAIVTGSLAGRMKFGAPFAHLLEPRCAQSARSSSLGYHERPRKQPGACRDRSDSGLRCRSWRRDPDRSCRTWRR